MILGTFAPQLYVLTPVGGQGYLALGDLGRLRWHVSHTGSTFSHLACTSAGRDENLIEYDVGFEPDGNVTALSIRGWFVTGAELDQADNDPMGLAAGADQVCLLVACTIVLPGTFLLGSHDCHELCVCWDRADPHSS